MKRITLLAAAISLALVGCKSFQFNDSNTPPADAVSALSQSKECKELRRRIMMGQANLNGNRAWEQNTHLSQLQDDYHNAGCE